MKEMRSQSFANARCDFLEGEVGRLRAALAFYMDPVEAECAVLEKRVNEYCAHAVMALNDGHNHTDEVFRPSTCPACERARSPDDPARKAGMTLEELVESGHQIGVDC